jgi:hypothetical protein
VPPPPTCPKKHWQSKCPSCVPKTKGCLAKKCSRYKPGYAKVIMNAKKCFDSPVSYIAISYDSQSEKAACADNKRGYKKRFKNEDKFEFIAKCGSWVDLYVQDDNFSNKGGPLTLPFKNPCKKQCGGFNPCTLCGPNRIKITCRCKQSCGKNCWRD